MEIIWLSRRAKRACMKPPATISGDHGSSAAALRRGVLGDPIQPAALMFTRAFFGGCSGVREHQIDDRIAPLATKVVRA
ncbi:MAG: hypothetical protein AAF360_01590, partial [Pseudomonadota bacterium]